MAGQWARKRGVPVSEFPADWNRMGRGAGHARNALMLETFRPDLVAAFKDGFDRSLSRGGTEHMVKIARAAGVATLVVDRISDGPSRALDSVKGVPASEPVVAAEASTGASTPKDPRPVMHLITSLSVVKGGVAATVGCSAVLPVMPRADLFENASSWYSLTTCPECRARVEHDDAH